MTSRAAWGMSLCWMGSGFRILKRATRFCIWLCEREIVFMANFAPNVLFDDVVDTRQEVAREIEAERLRCFQVYHQLELVHLQHRQRGGVRPLQDARRIARGL